MAVTSHPPGPPGQFSHLTGLSAPESTGRWAGLWQRLRAAASGGTAAPPVAPPPPAPAPRPGGGGLPYRQGPMPALGRGQATFEGFTRALEMARHPDRPDRSALLPYYRSVMGDAHLSSVWQQRRLATLGRPYALLDAEGQRAGGAAARLLEGPWFGQFLEGVLESLLMGYTLVQLSDPGPDGPAWAGIVPPERVEPHAGRVHMEGTGPGADGQAQARARYRQPRDARAATDGQPYREGPLELWLVGIGDPGDLGLLYKATPLILWKQTAMAQWSRAVELFGMPFRKGHTDMNDPEGRERMAAVLASMGTAGWGVFDLQDRIEFVSQQTYGPIPSHEAMARFCDEQISKLVLGQTMTTDQGSSLSQAQVHERVFAALSRADGRRIERVVNMQLLPRLARMGYPVTGLHFAFAPDQAALEPELKARLVLGLLPYKQIPDSYLRSEFGLECTSLPRADEIQTQALAQSDTQSDSQPEPHTTTPPTDTL